MTDVKSSTTVTETRHDEYVSNRFDRFFTIKPTPRVNRLREALLSLKTTASIDRARIETRVMKETAVEPMITRRAKVFAAAAREMPIYIFPDELLVGNTGVRPYCYNVTPLTVVSGQTLASIMGGGTGDAYTKIRGTFGLSDDEMRELTEDILPYARQQGMVAPLYHYGHNAHGLEKVLRKGFLGIKREAEERLARLDPATPEDLKKIPFIEGVVLAMEAAAEVGQRFAMKAREQAATEKNNQRKTELLKIAEVCDWVPAHPARTFYEALQSYHFAWLLLVWELSYDWAFALGRVDQYLYPYYESDIREGRITKEEAQELLDCYILKLNFVNTAGVSSCTIGVGGVKANGQDATNELSYMLIEAMMHTKLPSPWFSVQVHSKTPDKLLVKACQLCALGTSHPQFLNGDVMVAQMLARGDMGGPMVTLEDARAASSVGCEECVIPGKDSGYLYYDSHTNLALPMELAMTNGVRRLDQKKIGLETGDPRQFKSFEEVREAYSKQLAWMRRNKQIFGNKMEQRIIELLPTVYESALIDNCIEKGLCREEGGAHYNFNTGSVPIGPTDPGDSLTAIKKLVFDDKKITMAELCEALDHNFKGYKEIRMMCLEAPKFGNDDDYADEQVAWVLHQWVSEFTKLKNLRGGYGCPGASVTLQYVPAGKYIGALPSGRLAGEPLADAASPSPGKDLNGPTAVLKSLSKIDHIEILGGIVLNMRIDTAAFRDEDGVRRLADMIRSAFDQKIFHVQINVVSSDILRAAQKEPEKYRDLVVKVAGYSAFFTRLSKELQDSIIARTEHKL
jgi:formate C-acetyltransferase